ncbi:phosphatase PAP2 family protein [uncultured Sphingomonas sp.]|uniref:phosphatase PAP2 family protein n=1 Tax=uncultured Sphingomonas sp. TaxID=158754 RepID=UPI0025EA3589|nr:phosphatase PAP2 family protein [uncultured Sphingomonas sp.]
MTKVKTAAKRLEKVDRKLTHKASAKHDTPAMRAAARVGELADQPPLIALSAATLALGLILRRRSVAEAGARMLASHLLATAAKEVVKRSIDRTRPHSVKKGHDYKLAPGDDRSHHYSSFPSGHTAGAVAVARAAARVWPERTPSLSLAAASAGAIQLPIAKHYVGDVVAGAAIGLASEWVVDAVVRAATPDAQ